MASELKVSITGDGKKLDGELAKVAGEVSKLENQTKNAKKEFNNLNNSINGSISGLSNLGKSIASGNFSGLTSGILSLGKNLQGLVPIMGSVGTAGASMGAMLNAALGPIGLITAAIGAVGAVTIGAVKSVADFETHVDQLQSLTGLDDSSMKEVSASAIEMSKDFKASASDIIDSMKLIGSQAPVLLQDKDALEQVTRSANVLAEAAGIEVVDAAKGITTVMNQMGVSASKADEIINVLAASSQKGSADVDFLNTAFEKAGTVASNAGLSYQELASAIETVGPKFGSAEVAGTSLAAMFKALEKQTDSNLKPSVVGINQALDNLAKKNLTTAESIKLFGDAGYTAADALIKQKEQFKQMTDAISGTNTAYEQMATNTNNLQGCMDMLKSQWEACLLQFGQSEFIQKLIEIFKEMMEVIGHLIKVVFDLVDAIMNMDGVKVVIALIVGAFKNIITVIDAVISIVEALIALWNKGMNYMRGLIAKFYNAIADTKVFKWLKEQFHKIQEWVYNMVAKAKQIWNSFLEWLGLKQADKSIPKPSYDSGGDSGPKVNESYDDTPPPTAEHKSGSSGKSGKSSKSGSSGKSKNNTTKTTTTEVVKTQLELNEEQLNQQEKTLTDAITRFNKGLINKEQLESAVETANKYFKDHNIKEHVELTYETDEMGFEKAEQKKIEKLKTEIELRRESLDKLTKQLGEATDDFEKNLISKETYKKIVDNVNAELKSNGFETIEIDVDVEFKKNVLKKAQEELSEISDAFTNHLISEEVFNERLKNINKKLEQYNIKPLKAQIEPEPKPGSLKYLEEQISELEARIEVEIVGSEEWNRLSKEIADLSNQKHKIEIDIDKKKVKTQVEEMEKLENTINGIGNAFNNFGSAIEDLSESVGVAKTALIAQAIGQLALSFAGAMKGTWTPWDWIAGALSGVGVLTSLVASLKKFAGGGIVGGKTTVGDFNIARLNKGEMILNGSQQSRLFGLLNKNGFYSSGKTLDSDVRFVIEGKTLVGVLSNYNKKVNKVL